VASSSAFTVVQFGEQLQRFGDWLEFRIQGLWQRSKRMQPPDFMVETEQQIVGNREQRALERRKNGKFVLGPFHGSERGAQRFHFLAAMKRFRSNQQMRNLAGFQAPNIIASNVFSIVREAPEQKANVAG
jgi:hypothetical protein